MNPSLSNPDAITPERIRAALDATTASTTANGVFIRHDMGDTPGNNGGTWSACPDIYFSTTSPTDHTPIPMDSSKIITDAGYASGDNGSYVTQGAVNYVYLRARNNAASLSPPPQMNPRFWFQYTSSNLAIWPEKWLSSGIQVAGDTSGSRNYQDGTNITSTTTTAGLPLMVTNEPFLWTPPVLTDGSHYCCIFMAENPLDNPPWIPNPGAMPTWDALMNFVLANDWFGWRNTQAAQGLGQTWQRAVPLSGPPAGGAAYVGIGCSNMPTDGYFAYTVMGPDGTNVINVPKSPIMSINQQVTNPMVFPPNFNTQVVITYWQGATVPPAGAKISPLLQQEKDTAEQIVRLMSGRAPNRAPERALVYDGVKREFDHWKTFYTFGGVPFQWEPITPAQGAVAVPASYNVRPRDAMAEPTWQTTVPIDIGAQGGLFYLGIRCTEMPTDGFVAASAAGPDPANSFNIPRTPITNPNMTILNPVQWPAGFSSKMTIRYWQGATPPPPNASITSVMMKPGTPSADADPD